jgi:hypothetical protein
VITRLTEQWKAEQRAFAARDLAGAGRPQAREGRCWFHKTANVLAAAELNTVPVGAPPVGLIGVGMFTTSGETEIGVLLDTV